MIVIIMGVSGCGKSTLGTLLSEKLGWPLYEGDDFHPPENIDKMARGEALTDQDRFPWLHKLHQATVKARRSSSDAIVVCSALKRLYRLILLHGRQALTSSSCSEREALPPSLPGVYFLFLNGDYELIHQRMVARSGHYMRADMLQSQFSALEPPGAEERVLTVDIRKDIGDIVTEVVNLLSLRALP
ncbi:probable gluconokinase isoform X1 [Gadus chalcogrammus]|uniref:probable gluconokinase isoform X1 n=1 Tax=Gadus chalcogrammus TaxID=1042646 RepID=UPI0024C2AD36|nr:probable gluconokinase isoform X1 [Gadus chalcogrammus]